MGSKVLDVLLSWSFHGHIRSLEWYALRYAFRYAQLHVEKPQYIEDKTGGNSDMGRVMEETEYILKAHVRLIAGIVFFFVLLFCCHSSFLDHGCCSGWLPHKLLSCMAVPYECISAGHRTKQECLGGKNRT